MALQVDDVDLGRDRALVERYQAGDGAAFDDLYSRYFRRLHRYCARRVHDPHAAEEIAQEAFVRALQALPRLEGDRRFYPWMTVIAARLCVDHHRLQQRTQPTDDLDPGLVDPEIDHVFRAVDLAHLATALERINPRHRRVLELREREGLSYEDIATRMDVTLGTVEALLHRARKALRREFLAVAGQPGRLVGVPVLGWLVRGLDRLRTRAAELAPLSQPVAIGVASVAMVVAPAVVSADHTPNQPHGTVVAAAGALSGGAGYGALADTLDAYGETGPAHVAPTGTAAPGEPDAAERVAAVNSPDVSVGDPNARHRAERQPATTSAGPVVVGADPAEILRDTTGEIDDLLEPAS